MKLPVVSGKETIKALSKIGYYIRDQKGSHVHMRHPIKRPLRTGMTGCATTASMRHIFVRNNLIE